MSNIIKMQELKEKYEKVLELYDSKHYDHNDLAKLLDESINYVKEKYPLIDKEHQKGAVWILTRLFEQGKTPDVKDTIDKFMLYIEGYDSYMNSLIISQSDFDARLTFYNYFIFKY